MKILLPLTLITALLLLYALWGREWLKSKTWAQGFFAWVEPIELKLFKKSETILFARLLTGLGGVLTLLTQLGSIDISPILPLVPDKYAGIVQTVYGFLPLLITGVGAIVEWLRNRTTKPIELVAIAEKDITPAVEAAIITAEVAKVEAVAVAAEAKAS